MIWAEFDPRQVEWPSAIVALQVEARAGID